jgi:hypothetical protein
MKNVVILKNLEDLEKYRNFARFLMNSKIFKIFEEYEVFGNFLDYFFEILENIFEDRAYDDCQPFHQGF